MEHARRVVAPIVALAVLASTPTCLVPKSIQPESEQRASHGVVRDASAGVETIEWPTNTEPGRGASPSSADRCRFPVDALNIVPDSAAYADIVVDVNANGSFGGLCCRDTGAGLWLWVCGRTVGDGHALQSSNRF